MTFAVRTEGLTRRFGDQIAVNGLSLRVPARSVYGFLGRNGAGKTTAIRLMLGLLKPHSGSTYIHDLCVQKERRSAAAMVGALVETPCHYDNLTGAENLAVSARLLGAARSGIEKALVTVGLANVGSKRVRDYSLGMRQRLGVARALLGNPRVLILDEPTNGLDPDGVVDMRELIKTLPELQDVTVFLSSHMLSEVEQVATHVGLIHDGELLLESSINDLRRAQSKTIHLSVNDLKKALQVLNGHGIAARAEGVAGLVVVEPQSAEIAYAHLGHLNAELVTAGVEVTRLYVEEPSLENIFMSTLAQASNRAALGQIGRSAC